MAKMGIGNVQDLLKEYGVQTEQELQEKLMAESLTLPCIYCRIEYPIEKLMFLGDDPVCPNCR